MSEYEVAVDLLRTVFNLNGHADAITSHTKFLRNRINELETRVAELESDQVKCCGKDSDCQHAYTRAERAEAEVSRLKKQSNAHRDAQIEAEAEVASLKAKLDSITLTARVGHVQRIKDLEAALGEAALGIINLLDPVALDKPQDHFDLVARIKKMTEKI